MNQIRSRQIARLEKRALPYIKQREGIAQQFQNLHRGAVAHAAVLAFVMRYGNPQMGEPLSEACQRVTESEAWEACCEKFPEECKNFRDRNFRVQYSFGPYNRDRVSSIGELLRHMAHLFYICRLYSQIAGSEFAGSFERLWLCTIKGGFPRLVGIAGKRV
jgi:hypothetical protein